MSVKKWDYLVHSFRDGTPSEVDLERVLKKHGAEGWELVHVMEIELPSLPSPPAGLSLATQEQPARRIPYLLFKQCLEE